MQTYRILQDPADYGGFSSEMISFKSFKVSFMSIWRQEAVCKHLSVFASGCQTFGLDVLFHDELFLCFYCPASVKIISGEATISCSASDSSLKGFSLVWSFNQNQMIVTKKEDDEQRVSEEWKQHVKDVSESGRLTLQHLSADHEGTYTCEVSKDEETNITQVSLSPAEESSEKLVFLSQIREIAPMFQTSKRDQHEVCQNSSRLCDCVLL